MNLTYKKISLEEANDTYQLEEKYQIPIHLYEDEEVRIIEKNVTIEGDWDLTNNPEDPDWEYGGGYIILGNLTVHGNITDTDIDFGPFIVVLGDVKAININLGGSHIYIQGNLSVKNLLYCEYNHGTFTVKGETKAALIISKDHHTHLENIQKGILVDYRSHGNFSKKADYDNESLNQLFTKEVFDEDGYFRGSKLWNLLTENKNYLQPDTKIEEIDF